jgi:hypothetical protein
MKKKGIPYGKLETDQDGLPKLGKLHSFDILHQPLKTHEGPGQGHGPLGSPRQGTTGIPFLQNIRVYQKRIKDANGKSKVVKQVMTFRTVSSKQRGSGKWLHPGVEAHNFFEAAEKWALDLWDAKIAPSLLARLEKSL